MKTRINKVVLLALLGASALGVLGFVGFRVLQTQNPTDEYERVKAQAIRAGLPLTPEEIVPQPPIDPSDNAAPLLTPILKRLKGDSAQRNEILRRVREGDFTGALASGREHFKLLDEAEPGLAKARLDFKRDYSLGAKVLFPEFASLKYLSQLAVARSRISAAQGKQREAIRYLRQGHRIEDLLRDEYTIIGHLVGISVGRITNRGYREVATAWRGDEAKLLALADSFDPPAPASLERTLKTETMVMFQTILNEFKPETSEAKPAERRLGQRAAIILLTEAVKDLKTIRESGNDTLAATREMQSRTDRLESQIFLKPEKRFLTILRPVYDQFGTSIVELAADKSLTDAYLQVLIYEAKAGHWPKNLEEAGVTAKEPFTLQPFGYRADVNGFRIWSVGGDQNDDNGATFNEMKAKNRLSPLPSEERGDLVAGYPLPR